MEVDSHTHMMFAGNRSHEFALRSQGATYRQIAEAGGGRLNTIGHVRAALAETIANGPNDFYRKYISLAQQDNSLPELSDAIRRVVQAK
ncbi:MAG: hypothetical protein HY961_19940 [Ignavibacteriae bacterium]|nr:hypothetical protein [Ignavibacteriota bacterium]